MAPTEPPAAAPITVFLLGLYGGDEIVVAKEVEFERTPDVWLLTKEAVGKDEAVEIDEETMAG